MSLNISCKCGVEQKHENVILNNIKNGENKSAIMRLFKRNIVLKNEGYIYLHLTLTMEKVMYVFDDDEVKKMIHYFLQRKINLNIIKKAMKIFLNDTKPAQQLLNGHLNIDYVKTIIDDLQKDEFVVYNNKNINNNNRNKEKKRLTLFDYGLKYKFPKANVSNMNKGRPYKKYLTINDEHWIQRNHMMHGIERITQLLKQSDMFDFLPNIDCFASKHNYQRQCKHYITKEMDYFSEMYNATQYWSDKVVWCFTPYIRKIIVDTINSFRKRKIKGYVFSPYEQDQTWIGQTQRICDAYCIMPKRNKSIYEIDAVWNCYFDSILFYFNFQK